jgi:tetratricopeptide (TPR) repeat protein
VKPRRGIFGKLVQQAAEQVAERRCRGALAGAFGDAYSEIGEFDHAIRWYSRVVSAEDGRASLRASEQLRRRGGNIENKAKARQEIQAAIRQLERLVADHRDDSFAGTGRHFGGDCAEGWFVDEPG